MKGLIFSFDNVLCDSRGIQRRALQLALKEYGYYWSHEMEREYERRNDRSRSRLDHLIEIKQIKREDVDLVEIAANSIENDLMSEYKISDRTIESFENLKNKHGIKLAIASDCNRSSIINFLKWTRLNEFFDYVTTSDDYPKPNPSVYVRTLQKMGFDPKDVVVREGSSRGLDAAESAGIKRVQLVAGVGLENIVIDIERSIFK